MAHTIARYSILSISLTLLALSGCASPKGYGPSPTYSGYGSSAEATSADSAGTSRPGRAHVRYSPTSAPRSRDRSGGGSSATVPPPAPRGPTAHRYHRAPTRRHIVRPRPTHRPGLATVFGERVRSRVSFTSFRRARTRPDGSAAIHYNDYQGLVAMARHLRRRCCGVLSAYRVGASVSVQLVDSYQRPLRGAQLSGRTIVMGRAGTRYGILVRNLTNRRYEIVASVDGLDVIDGKRASLNKRGYVLAPYGKIHIRGFRTSRHNVAAFRFGSVANSYAARSTGSARNVGVVGVAVYSEFRPAYNHEVIRRLRARPFAQPPR